MNRIKGLDSLRAVAVIIVIRAHWGPASFRTSPALDFFIKYIVPVGSFGVDLFFVLSGFLITRILLKAKQDAGSKSKTDILKTFILRRSLRIFPLYFVFLFVLYLFNYPEIRRDIVYYATYTVNFMCFDRRAFSSFTHTWTLSVEEQFYLLWPLFILFVSNRYLVLSTTLVIIFSTIASAITSHLYGPYHYLLTFNCFNAFAIGGLYALTVTFNTKSALSKPWGLPILITAVIFYIARYFGIDFIPVRLLNSIICIAVIMRVAEARYSKIEAIFFENKLLNGLGKISYGVYLFHYSMPAHYHALLNYFKIYDNGRYHLFYIPAISELIQFSLLVLAATASYYWLEKPFLKLKDMFKYSFKTSTS